MVCASHKETLGEASLMNSFSAAGGEGMNELSIFAGNSTCTRLRQESAWCLGYGKEANVERWMSKRSMETHEVRVM